MAFAAQADAAAVAEILRDSGRQTLVDGLAHAVPCEGQARHWMQEKFAEMVRAALQELQRTSAAQHEQFEPTVAAAQAAIQQAETAQGAAAEAKKAAVAAVEEKAQAVERCRAALAKTKLERADAEAARHVVLRSWSGLEARRSGVAFLLEGPLRMLLDGDWEDEEGRDAAAESVAKALTEVGAEAALVVAAPVALAVRPQSREEFDRVTVDSAVEVLEERASSLNAQLLAAAPALEDAEAEALGLLALAERESGAEHEAKELCMVAKYEAKQATRALEEAGAEIARRHAALSDMLSGHVLEEERAKRIAAAMDAAERLVAFEYSTVQPSADAPADDAAMATVWMEIVQATADAQLGVNGLAEDSAMATESTEATEESIEVTACAKLEPVSMPPKVEVRSPIRGNPLRVPTPMNA